MSRDPPRRPRRGAGRDIRLTGRHRSSSDDGSADQPSSFAFAAANSSSLRTPASFSDASFCNSATKSTPPRRGRGRGGGRLGVLRGGRASGLVDLSLLLRRVGLLLVVLILRLLLLVALHTAAHGGRGSGDHSGAGSHADQARTTHSAKGHFFSSVLFSGFSTAVVLFARGSRVGRERRRCEPTARVSDVRHSRRVRNHPRTRRSPRNSPTRPRCADRRTQRAAPVVRLIRHAADHPREPVRAGADLEPVESRDEFGTHPASNDDFGDLRRHGDLSMPEGQPASFVNDRPEPA